MEAVIQSISVGVIILAGGIGIVILSLFVLGSKLNTMDKKLDKLLKHLEIEEDE